MITQIAFIDYIKSFFSRSLITSTQMANNSGTAKHFICGQFICYFFSGLLSSDFEDSAKIICNQTAGRIHEWWCNCKPCCCLKWQVSSIRCFQEILCISCPVSMTATKAKAPFNNCTLSITLLSKVYLYNHWDFYIL